MVTGGPEGTGVVYEILGPHYSIHDGKSKCVVDPIERSLTTPRLMCGKLELERPKPRSNGAMEFMNEELPDEKEGVLVKLLRDLETEKMGMVWFTDTGEGGISSGPGRYGVNKSRVSLLLFLH